MKLWIHTAAFLAMVGIMGCQTPQPSPTVSFDNTTAGHQEAPVREESKVMDDVSSKQEWEIKLQKLYRDYYDAAYRGEKFALGFIFGIEPLFRYKDVPADVGEYISQSHIFQKFRDQLLSQAQSPDAIVRTRALERLQQLERFQKDATKRHSNPITPGANTQLYEIDLWKLLHKLGDQVFFDALKVMDESVRKTVIQHLDNEAKRREEDYSKKYPQTYGLIPRR